ncbi:MAG: hypothetical protein ACI906_004417, partial [Candidatus Latescibacterota bacterium]
QSKPPAKDRQSTAIFLIAGALPPHFIYYHHK